MKEMLDLRRNLKSKKPNFVRNLITFVMPIFSSNRMETRFFDSIKNNTYPQASPLYLLGEMGTALTMEKSNNLQEWITTDYTN